jgi:hypothetical protein
MPYPAGAAAYQISDLLHPPRPISELQLLAVAEHAHSCCWHPAVHNPLVYQPFPRSCAGSITASPAPPCSVPVDVSIRLPEPHARDQFTARREVDATGVRQGDDAARTRLERDRHHLCTLLALLAVADVLVPLVDGAAGAKLVYLVPVLPLALKPACYMHGVGVRVLGEDEDTKIWKSKCGRAACSWRRSCTSA